MENLLEQNITESNEQKKIIDIFTASFATDPIARWMYKDISTFLKCYPVFAAAFTKVSFETNNVYKIGDFSGAAAWVKPQEHVCENSIIDSIETTIEDEIKKNEIYEIFEKMDKFHPQEPVWYLPLVGVEPFSSNKGLGHKLITQKLLQADKEGIATYLESTNPRNISFYERLGFKKLGSLSSATSPEIYPMLRLQK